MRKSISYAITVCNEAEELDRLLSHLSHYVQTGDEVVVQADADHVTDRVQEVVKSHAALIARYATHPLRFDFAQAKNHLNNLCNGEYIFQLDADELPHPQLLMHLQDILHRHPLIELFKFPRINYLLDTATYLSAISDYTTISAERIAWPDYQGRLYKNRPRRIRWHRPLHERIRGHILYLHLPKRDEYAIIHLKAKEQDAAKWAEWRKQMDATPSETSL